MRLFLSISAIHVALLGIVRPRSDANQRTSEPAHTLPQRRRSRSGSDEIFRAKKTKKALREAHLSFLVTLPATSSKLTAATCCLHLFSRSTRPISDGRAAFIIFSLVKDFLPSQSLPRSDHFLGLCQEFPRLATDVSGGINPRRSYGH